MVYKSNCALIGEVYSDNKLVVRSLQCRFQVYKHACTGHTFDEAKDIPLYSLHYALWFTEPLVATCCTTLYMGITKRHKQP